MKRYPSVVIGSYICCLRDTACDRSSGPKDKDRNNDTLRVVPRLSRVNHVIAHQIIGCPCGSNSQLEPIFGDCKADQRLDCFRRYICRLAPRRWPPRNAMTLLTWVSENKFSLKGLMDAIVTVLFVVTFLYFQNSTSSRSFKTCHAQLTYKIRRSRTRFLVREEKRVLREICATEWCRSATEALGARSLVL